MTGLAERVAQLAASHNLPAIADADALVARLQAMGCMVHEFVRDGDLLQKLRTLATDAKLFVQDVPLNGPGPRLPPAFAATLGSLDWSQLNPNQKLHLWSAWAEANGISARTPNSAAQRVVAPVGMTPAVTVPLDVQRLQSELERAEAAGDNGSAAQRRMRESRIGFIRAKLDAARKRHGLSVAA